MSTKILITGATGYIGGSVLSQLLDSTDPNIKSSRISVLVRGEEKAKDFAQAGITPILFSSLDESDVLEKAASEHDVVINTASGFHTPSAIALIKGLGKRKAAQGGEPLFIHTSGTSNLGDRPITGLYHESREFYDNEDIYSYLQHREQGVQYDQRTTDVAVVETGKQVGIKTYLIMSPLIYGFGLGRLGKPNTLSVQIPNLIRSAIKVGQSEYLGDGQGIWDYVHIADLTPLYEIVLSRILADEPIPVGEKAVFFSATGRFTWKQLAQNIADAGLKLGALKTNEVASIGLEEAGQKWTGGNLLLAELGFSSNSRSNSVLPKEWGWAPKKTEEDFKKHFEEEFYIIYSGRH